MVTHPKLALLGTALARRQQLSLDLGTKSSVLGTEDRIRIFFQESGSLINSGAQLCNGANAVPVTDVEIVAGTHQPFRYG